MKIRRLEAHEWHRIQDFYKSYHAERERLLNRELWEWQFLDMPLADRQRLAFFVIEVDDEICGTIGAIPLMVRSYGIHRSGCHPINFYVAPGYGGLPALRLRAAVLADFDIVIAANISDDTDRLSKASRYINYADHLKRYVMRFSASREAKVESDPNVRPLRLLMRRFWLFGQRLKLKASGAPGIRQLESPGHAQFAELRLPDPPSGVIKDADYLVWRYLRSPALDCRFFVAESRNGHHLLGVLHQRDNGDAVILDLVGDCEDRLALTAMIAALARFSRAAGASSLTSVCMGQPFQSAFRQLGFSQQSSRLGLQLTSVDKAEKSRLAEQPDWRFVLGDTDLF